MQFYEYYKEYLTSITASLVGGIHWRPGTKTVLIAGYIEVNPERPDGQKHPNLPVDTYFS